MRRAAWGSALTAVSTIAYYFAYAYIVWRTLHGEFTIGNLTFLAGSFLRLRGLLEQLLSGFSSVAGQGVYLHHLLSFFQIQPATAQPANPPRFPTTVRLGVTFA